MDNVRKETKEWTTKRERTIQKLIEVANEINKYNKNSSLTRTIKTISYKTNTLGSAAFLAGLVLSPFTGGTSLILSGVGGGTSFVSTTVGIGAIMIENALSKPLLKETKDVCEEDIKATNSLIQTFEEAFEIKDDIEGLLRHSVIFIAFQMVTNSFSFKDLHLESEYSIRQIASQLEEEMRQLNESVNGRQNGFFN